MNIELLIPLFFLVALCYSMAGFGGGSSYIALMVLFSVPFQLVPPIGLICNLVVVSVGTYQFWKAGHLSKKLAIPFLVSSIPMAFLGGSISIPKKTFLFLLAGSLLCAGINMLLPSRSQEVHSDRIPSKNLWLTGIPVGSFLGALSGMIGIGGGIFLSPILNVLRWGNSKQIAATASLFIFFNSFSGLVSRWNSQDLRGIFHDPVYGLLPLAVLLGGIIGSSLTSFKLSFQVVRRVTALLVLYASIQLWIRAFNS
jgi:uncharacterized membrane protein YfcA